MYENYKRPDKRATFLPYDFSVLLNFLAAKAKQELIRNRISETKHFNVEKGMEDCKRFIELFDTAINNDLSFASDEKIYRNLMIDLQIRNQSKILDNKLSGLRQRRTSIENTIRDFYNSQKIKDKILKDKLKNKGGSQINVIQIYRMNSVEYK